MICLILNVHSFSGRTTALKLQDELCLPFSKNQREPLGSDTLWIIIHAVAKKKKKKERSDDITPLLMLL